MLKKQRSLLRSSDNSTSTKILLINRKKIFFKKIPEKNNFNQSVIVFFFFQHARNTFFRKHFISRSFNMNAIIEKWKKISYYTYWVRWVCDFHGWNEHFSSAHNWPYWLKFLDIFFVLYCQKKEIQQNYRYLFKYSVSFIQNS